jgi:hypothetical protein
MGHLTGSVDTSKLVADRTDQAMAKAVAAAEREGDQELAQTLTGYRLWSGAITDANCQATISQRWVRAMCRWSTSNGAAGTVG